MVNSLENILSPMIANRNVVTQALNQQDLILMENQTTKIRRNSSTHQQSRSI